MMSNKSRNLLLILGAATILLLVGGFIYAKQKNASPQNPPNADQDCRTFDSHQSCAKDYIGLIESDAVSRANSLKQPYRIVQREDETFAVTQDYSKDRLNFTIKGGVVSKAEFY